MPCLRQRALPQSDSQHSATREFILLSNHCRPVDFRFGALRYQERVGSLSSSGSTFTDEFESLCDEGQLDKAINRMEQKRTIPSVNMYRTLLKACAKRKALAQAKRVSSHLVKCGQESTMSLGEDAVKVLVKCNGLADAVQLFHMLPQRSVVSWTAVLSGYIKAGQGRQALSVYKTMQDEGVRPNKYTFISLITACGNLRDIEKGRHIHSQVVKDGCESDLFVATCLVDMYAKCGSISDAQTVFDAMTLRDVVSWNAMLAGYAQQQQPEKALQLYRDMQIGGVSATDRTFVSVIQACGLLAEKEDAVLIDQQLMKTGSMQVGKALHGEVWRMGCASDIFVGNALVSLYAKCGSILDAENMFEGLSQKDVVSWTALLAAYAQTDQGEKALKLYEETCETAISPDDRTFVSALQGCGSLAGHEEAVSVQKHQLKPVALQKGKQIHAAARHAGYEQDVFVGNALISMYGRCGDVDNALAAFDALALRNGVSWNAVIMAYVQQAQAEEAMKLYEQMLEEGVSPSESTFVAILQTCGMVAEMEEDVVIAGQRLKWEALDKAKALHARISQRGFETNVFVGSTLISVYGKCWSAADAHNVFDGLSQRNVVSWSVMVAAYAQQGQAEKALQLYDQMKAQGACPNEVTFMHILQACNSNGGLDICKQIHRDLVSTSENLSLDVASTLMHTYGKCGSMVDAQNVFNALPRLDVVAWNVLIAGYARQGDFESAFQSLEAMQLSGVQLNGAIFLSLLSACSHAGMVDRGVQYLESMTRDYSITPEMQHYVSVVDLLGRAGYFGMVEHLLSKMPMEPDLSLWLCLLGACQKHSNLVLGKRAFDFAVQLEPKHAAAYVLMSNIYADAGLWERADEVYKLRLKAGAWKQPGQSWLQHEQARTFLVGGCHHHESQQMREFLRRLDSLEEFTSLVA